MANEQDDFRPPEAGDDNAIIEAPSFVSRRRCVCSWGSVCAELQSILIAYCTTNQVNHVALGFVRITNSPGSSRLKQSVVTHLLKGSKLSSSSPDIAVARHHFPMPLLHENGNKEQVVNGLKLPVIPGHGNKVKTFFTALPQATAQSFGIHEEVDRFTKDRTDKKYKFFVQAPLAPLSLVRETIYLLRPSERCERASRFHGRQQITTQNRTSLSLNSQSTITGMGMDVQSTKELFLSTPPRPRQPLPEPTAPCLRRNTSKLQFCSGIKNEELDEFAKTSYINRGYCSTVYSYDVVTSAWRSPECTVTVYTDQEHQCDACSSASRQVYLTLPQITLGSQWEYDSIVLGQEQLRSMIQRRYTVLHNDAAFLKCKIVNRAIIALREIHHDTSIVALDNQNTYARICVEKGPVCGALEIVKKRSSEDGGVCDSCRPYKKMRMKRHTVLQARAAGSELHANHNFDKMTREDLLVLLREKTKRLRYVNRQLRTAQVLLSREHNSSFIAPEDDELMQIMTSASQHITNNKESARASIVLALIEAGKVKGGKAAEHNAAVHGEYDQFADSILEEIDNFTRVKIGHNKQVRFSPRVMRMALSLYLSGPGSYEGFRKQMSTIQVMPSVSTLKKLKNSMTPEEGTFPRCYGWFFDEFFESSAQVKEGDRFGHILCDEMKLKSDFFWNPATHKCVGIVVDGDLESRIDLADELRKMYADSVWDEINNDSIPTSTTASATGEPSNNGPTGTTSSSTGSSNKTGKKKNPSNYSVSLTVNQYRFRSANNHTHTGEFFFNNGSLSGDELLRQAKQVIFGYEMIGVRIVGFLCDGGGNNARLFKLLRNGAEPVEGKSWLDESQVSFPNPADPSRRIAMCHCTTHGLKNMRNALYSSCPGSKRTTKDFSLGTIHFGWDTVTRCYHRDKIRPLPDSALKHGSVKLDQWNKMDVSLAKDPFKFDTLSEQVLYLAEALDCVCDVLKVKWNSDEVGGSDKILRQVDVLKASALEKAGNVDKVVMEDLCSLEYCAVIGYIYIENFMNRQQRLTRDNVDQLEGAIRRRLVFFEKWRVDQLQKRAAKSSKWEKSFLSHVTYLNMRIGLCGFFTYARYLLKESLTTTFVPFLHSNTSIIEALFSQIRRMQRDTPPKYAAGAGTADTTLAHLHVNNGMYSSDDLADTSSPCKTLERVTMRFDDKRDKKVDALISDRETLLQLRKIKPKSVRISTASGKASGLAQQDNQEEPLASSLNSAGYLKNIIQQMPSRMSCHYSEVFWSDKDFVEYAKLSVRTPGEICFERLSQIGHDEELELDSACQWLYCEISNGAMNVAKTTRSIDRSFMLQVFRVQTNKRQMQQFWRMMPASFRINDASKMICQLLVDFVAKLFMTGFHLAIDNWLYQMKESCGANDSPVVEESEDDENNNTRASTNTSRRTATVHDEQKEVQMFFGWALSSVAKKYECKDDFEDVTSFCQEMFVSHDEVVIDEGYMKDFYPPIVQMKNRGDLALVARPYFNFGIELLQQIRELFNKATISKFGKQCVKLAYEELSEDLSLREDFLQCANSHADKLSEDTIVAVFVELVKKTFHARVGAETSLFKEENTSRFAADAVDTALREGLKTLSKAKGK